MNVESILRAKGRHVATIRPDATVGVAVARMTDESVGALVVSGDGRTIEGLLSERLVVRALAAHGAGLIELPVASIMTRRVETCAPHDGLREIATRMTDRRTRHLPVVEADRLVGIVSIGDVVKSRLDEVEAEASSLRAFITTA